MLAVYSMDLYIFVCQNIYTDLDRIVEDGMEIVNKPLRIQQIHCMEGFVRQFLHTQQDDAAVGIGESGVGFPDTFRQTAQCLFGFDTVVFPVVSQVFKIQNGVSSCNCSTCIIAQRPAFSNSFCQQQKRQENGQA